MLILRDPTMASSITDPDIRRLVELRYVEICAGDPYDYDSHGYMIVMEPSDSVDALEEESSCPILRNLFDKTCFGDPDFAPSCEALEEHSACYEMVFILNDDGFGIEIFIPKTNGIGADLLGMCAMYAEPAPALTPELTQP